MFFATVSLLRSAEKNIERVFIYLMQFLADNSVIEAKSTRITRTKHSRPEGITASGHLNVETWRYYVREFGCSHFKGKGIEDNYYLLRPIFLSNGTSVNSRKKFFQAKQEQVLIEGEDYITNDHMQAIDAAITLYHPEYLYRGIDYN